MKKIFFYSITLLTSIIGFAQLPTTGLVAHYPFNNSIAGSPGPTGTNNSAAYTTDRFGNTNSAILVSNNNSTNSTTAQYVDLPNPGSPFFNNDFTIIFWFKSIDGRRMYLLSNDQIGTGTNLNFELNDGGAYYCYWNGQGSPGFNGGSYSAYADNKWHQVVIRRNSTTLDLYIDMVLKQSTSSASGTIGYNTNNIAFGFNKANYPGYPNLFYPYGFNGSMDDVSFYNVAVPIVDLISYYNNGLIAYFDFNGGLTDATGNLNTAALDKTTLITSDLPTLTYDRFGNCNNAYNFNGNGFIKINPFSSNSLFTTLNYFTNDFSISYWLKSAKQNKRMYTFSLDNNSTSSFNNNLNIELNDSDTPSPAFWAYWNGQGYPGFTLSNGVPNVYTDNNWHLVTFTRNKNTSLISLFIDGVLKSTYTDNSTTIGNNSDIINIGHIRQPYVLSNYPIFNTYGFEGIIDDIKFYNKVLTPTDVTNEYTSTNPFVSALTINFPIINNNWAIDSYHNITWNSTTNNPINISISYNFGSTWTTLGSGLASSNTSVNKFLWKVVASSAGNAQIKIEDGTNCTIRPFNIIASQESSCYSWQCVLNATTTADVPNCPSTATYTVPRWRDGAELKTFTNSLGVTKMYLMGGWNPSGFSSWSSISNIPNNYDGSQAFHNTRSNEIWSSTDGYSWAKEKAFSSVTYPNTSGMWEERHFFPNLVYNNKVWVIGGDINGQHYQNDIWNSTDMLTWNWVASKPSTGIFSTFSDRFLSLYNVFNNKMWIMGGQSGYGIVPITYGNNPPLAYYNDVYWSTDGITWNRNADAPWSPRGIIGGSVVFNNKMWVLGGGTYQTNYFNDVWSTGDGTNWTNDVDFAPWIGRQYHNVEVFDNKMWVIGGAVNASTSTSLKDAASNLKDVWYSSDGTNWYELPNTPWPHRHAAAVAVHNNALYLVSGNNIPSYTITTPQGNGPIDAYKLTCTGSSRLLNTTLQSNDKREILIYPNPGNGNINIDLSKIDEDYKIEIYNLTGAKLYQNNLSKLRINNLSDLKLVNGVYIVKIIDSKAVTIKFEKIIIQQ